MRRLVGPALAALLILVAVVLAIVGGGGDSSTDTLATPVHLADADELGELESSLGHDVYWAGERPPDRVELTVDSEGSAYLRYLPPGVAAGDPRPNFLLVGTYPVGDAQGVIRRLAGGANVSVENVADGGIALADPAAEGSAYLAYPDSDLQIEVYDPTPGRALELIRSGAIAPLDGD